MQAVTVEQQDTVAVVRLARSATNPINLALVHELAGAVRAAGDRHDVRGLVLASASDKFLSIGFDIPALIDLSREDFTTFYRAFCELCLMLYALPKPTVAAITGHAVAGGCILALCCDYRFLAAGRNLMGMNEVKLGVPVPYVADRILRHVVGARLLRDLQESGEFFPPDDLLRMGMVDRVLPPAEVLRAAIERAAALGAMPAASFALIKRNRIDPVAERVRGRAAESEREFLDCWFAPAARERLREAMRKF